ncbi:MAG: MFS transporter [Sandaracinaceae bacterium]|nr:MFS transporter [Sandaracinaceae bacterium]
MRPLMSAASEDTETSRTRALLLLGIVALSFNLRPAAVSVGPVLSEVRAGLHMSGTVAGVLTTMPVVAFALFGAAAPWLAQRVGAHRVTLLSLVAVVLGLLLRAGTGSAALFLLYSLLGLAGMATANVLLPSLVKLHFPARVGLMTSVYTTAMAIGLTTASMVTVPVASHFGADGWRAGLGVWALTALLAALPWLGLVRHDRRPKSAERSIRMRDVGRTRLGWAMALLFGLQSLQAYSIFGWFAQVYRDAGFSAEKAGVLLGLITAVGIPLSFVIPTQAARLQSQRPAMWALMLCYPVGYVGLMVAPVAGAYVWAVILGIASAVFPLVLTMIGLRSRTSAGTAALSGFTQAAGYLIAVVGPFGMGALYDLTGGWTLPLGVLTALTVPQLIVGLIAAGPGFIEDQLRVPKDAAAAPPG